MFIFTFGFAAWYAWTAGRRVESAQTVISEDSSWVTGLNPAVLPASVLVGAALAHPEATASVVMDSTASREILGNLMRWPFIMLLREKSVRRTP
jgi:hypothetical protein